MRPLTISEGLRDLLSDAWLSMAGRPGRSVLAVMAFGIGIGGLVSGVGISRTAAQQIVDELTPADLDEVRAMWVSGPGDEGGLPADSEERISGLNGVMAVGRRFSPGAEVRAHRTSPNASSDEMGVPVMVATSGMLDVAGATITPEASSHWIGSQLPDRVALLGVDAARELGVVAAQPGTSVWIGGRRFAVVGVISNAERVPSLLGSAVIGREVGLDVLSLHPSSEQLVIRTELQHARRVAEVIDLAVLPQNPDRVRVEVPPDPANVRRGVATELDRLAIASAVVVLVIAGIAISNTMAMGVMARRSEIGLRRALGASPAAIAVLVLAESALLGVVGGLVGIVAANVALVAISISQDWIPVFVFWLGPGALITGVLVGVIAGSYPALSAARINPAIALKGV